MEERGQESFDKNKQFRDGGKKTKRNRENNTKKREHAKVKKKKRYVMNAHNLTQSWPIVFLARRSKKV